MHEPSDELPAEELELEGYLRHVTDDEDPTVVEYVPDSQSAQTADQLLFKQLISAKVASC